LPLKVYYVVIGGRCLHRQLKDRFLNYFVAYCKAVQCMIASLFGAKTFKKASKVIKVGLDT